MADSAMMVEVVYADAQKPCLRRLEVPIGSTVMQVIDASGIAALLPARGIDPNRLGIFAKRVSGDHIVQAGDRIEIYRPLIIDPMEARRRRAR